MPERELRASVPGQMPGTDPVETAKVVLGELVHPHLPAVFELPDRGRTSDTLGRSVSVLEGIFADIQPYGWRVTDAPGKDIRSAVSARTSDLGIMADVIGETQNQPETLVLPFLGPLSLASSLHLHFGEKVISDSGARRDIAQSLAVGISEWVRTVRRATGVSSVVVLVSEPHADAALSGQIKTISGYRTLRAVDRAEALATWTSFVSVFKDDDAASVVLNLSDTSGAVGRAHAETLGRFASIGADGWYVDALKHRPDMGVWEGVAELIEADKSVWLGAIDVSRAGLAGHERESVTQIFESISQPWRNVGLSFDQFHQIVLTPTQGLQGQSPAHATRMLRRLTDLVDAGRQRIADA
ncbi:hypothetical protein [Neomicrococcus aestuarii]|uniref:Cobalamin-independent methionine synthase MetE C-terminal/archaeal domain-containing protein n=1 Tax=Neomicrococcus aestuarii TaxID=556325 RepID=A0A1L2ZJY7_9MICC|nr:hypothetical protein [Neomicrococcus aestuarii]APF39705.1 hypothetical protein BHE16_00245 [Neomicrococcus aestuarii]